MSPSPAPARPTLWDREPKLRKHARLVPFYTDIEYRDGRVVPLRRAYRVPWPPGYDRPKPHARLSSSLT